MKLFPCSSIIHFLVGEESLASRKSAVPIHSIQQEVKVGFPRLQSRSSHQSSKHSCSGNPKALAVALCDQLLVPAEAENVFRPSLDRPEEAIHLFRTHAMDRI